MPEITEKLRELAQTPWGKLVGLRELPHGWKLGIIRHAAKCRFEQDALAVALLWASGYGWQITCNDPRRTVVEVKGKYGRGDTLLKATAAELCQSLRSGGQESVDQRLAQMQIAETDKERIRWFVAGAGWADSHPIGDRERWMRRVGACVVAIVLLYAIVAALSSFVLWSQRRDAYNEGLYKSGAAYKYDAAMEVK